MTFSAHPPYLYLSAGQYNDSDKKTHEQRYQDKTLIIGYDPYKTYLHISC